MTTRLSCNHEPIFRRNRIHKNSVELGIEKPISKNSLLNGAIVVVFVGDIVHQCIIKSGIGGLRPFLVRSMQSGIVRQRFTADVAKKLRQQGRVLNMILVQQAQ